MLINLPAPVTPLLTGQRELLNTMSEKLVLTYPPVLLQSLRLRRRVIGMATLSLLTTLPITLMTAPQLYTHPLVFLEILRTIGEPNLRVAKRMVPAYLRPPTPNRFIVHPLVPVPRSTLPVDINTHNLLELTPTSNHRTSKAR